ncbi:unnamed protein product [Mytilus edulis]|uniref:Integrase p58-like C-terminal domain-containing protein n=1 Tax=Mytilus edulis TaxID=6550 RepID=A0A8S3QCU1_MYTED|nr:unnamed protein product [Mytilus edulis]
MLTAYVDEHHLNWDCLLSYVKMAYRSAQHETTVCTPFRMMLCREVATPAELMYVVPDYFKKNPQNKWAWELQERMEEAHHFVRKHVGQEMEYSDVNYLINCGRRGRPQVIHVDRMRLCKCQLLRGETEVNENLNQNDTFEMESVVPEISNNEPDIADIIVDQRFDEPAHTGRPSRVTKQPTWLHDFVR